jgi:hypothetical protein
MVVTVGRTVVGTFDDEPSEQDTREIKATVARSILVGNLKVDIATPVFGQSEK